MKIKQIRINAARALSMTRAAQILQADKFTHLHLNAAAILFFYLNYMKASKEGSL